MQEEMSERSWFHWGARPLSPSPHTCVLTPATPDSLLQNRPEGHPEEHMQVPAAAFLGLVEAPQQGAGLGASVVPGTGASWGWQAS